MPYDPKTIYLRLAELLGATRGDPALSRGEFWNFPGIGDVEINPQRKMGNKNWDASEIFKGYKQGDIPPWMKQAADIFSAGVASGKMGGDEISGFARHWLLGEGVDPFYAKAHSEMPAWMKAYLQGVFGGYVGTQNQGAGASAQ